MASKRPEKSTRTSSDIIPVSADVSRPGIPEKSDEHRSKKYELRRVFFLCIQAITNAVFIGFMAKGMMLLINLVTNLSFYGHFSFQSAAPGIEKLGIFVILIPVIGGVIVGLMARYGSPGIRGHGIPEAMEQILQNESKIKPILTFLKPISAVFAIGTGGPFGAEGPIISGGGALGSFAGQIMKINATERKIMLAAGACGGMAAIFGSPVASVLLAIELLLFEFSPRSLIPVALSAATGTTMHFFLFESTPIFAMSTIPSPGSLAVITYTLLGIIIGLAAAYASKAVYFLEDLYKKLPIHWMWWPAIGAVAIGVIGFFAPKTMGVGYSNISQLLTGNVSIRLLFILFFLKFLSWSISLASGTSGGTIAPLFTIGGGLGGLLGMLTLYLFPASGINIATAVLVGMAAMFAGASRALLTSIVFALETTGQFNGLLPLVGGCTSAYFASFFLMKGSIMTEKMNRQGFKTPETFEPNVLEGLLVQQVYNKDFPIIDADNTIEEARDWIIKHAEEERYTTFIVGDKNKKLIGIVQRLDLFYGKNYKGDTSILSLVKNNVAYIYPESSLHLAIGIMDKYDTDVLPVVSEENREKIIGGLSRKSIFTSYHSRVEEDEKLKQSIPWLKRGKEFFIRSRKKPREK